MQVLVPYEGSPEEYQTASAEREMVPPDTCPNCDSERRLRFHGYYSRFVSGQSGGEALLVRIRRYRCRDCLLTTSLLPWFCLSYRLVRGEAVAKFLRGDGIDSWDLRWQGLLSRCRQRFEAWLPELAIPLKASFGLDVKGVIATNGWRAIEDRLGQVGVATRILLSSCKITFFGRYLCHQPGAACPGGRGDHRNLLFSSGTDPPN